MATIVCPVCGTDNPTTRQFCRKCASDLRAPVRDPNAPPPEPPVVVPVRPAVIGGAIALVLVVLALGALLLLGGKPAASPAPSPSPSPSPTAAPTETPAAPTTAPTSAPTGAPPTEAEPTEQPPPLIRSFVGPTSVDCSDSSFSGTIHLSWRVGFADGATLAIDGPGLYRSYVGILGEDDVPFGCGGESHTYTLTTTGGNGPAATQTLTIAPK